MSTDINFLQCMPEIWGGIECTVNRVHNRFNDQLECSGHYNRQDDIDEFAALGIKALRYPVLWERHQPEENKSIDWTWTEQQLNKIKEKNITVIAGLLHHGSGPAYTDLSDPAFPEKFVNYANKVATKFPWIEYYTPINEPLTTARFSGLYGIWYPHYKDAYQFAYILLQQLKATVLAMSTIRSINPNAKLVQTEDLAKVQSTTLLKYQADFENERRWLTYDLLCGKVDKQHSLWNYFISIGIKEEMLVFFLENKCPPDIIGCNYYITSERYLDEKLENYPAHVHGGNGTHRYADTEAVRVGKLQGLKILLKEVWERYQIELAVTEVHLHCTREEQMRWFKEVWDNVCALRSEGINIKAITAWALLGSYDWSSLLTCRKDDYESGVYDVRNNTLRKTILTKLIAALSNSGDYDHPLLAEKGWWQNSISTETALKKNKLNDKKVVLITGKSGTLGNAFARICEARSIRYILLSRNELNICDEKSIERAVEKYKPWAIVNAAGFVKVDEAETAIDECLSINADGPGLLARACNKYGIRFMTFSSDLVFDGEKRSPYFETDMVQPINVYGTSKARGELLVLDEYPSSLIIRSSAFFGPWDKYNFAYNILHNLKMRKPYTALKDVFVSPTFVPDLVNTALDIFIDEETGIWHIANEGSVSWTEIAVEIAQRAGFEKGNILSKTLSEVEWKARRPLYSVLQSGKGIQLPSLDNAIDRFFKEAVL